MAFTHYGPVRHEGLNNYRIRLWLEDGAGVGQTGLVATMTAWLAKADNTSAQILTAGGGERTVVEVDNTNMPGVYDFELTAGDLDTIGATTLWVDGGGSSEPVAYNFDVLGQDFFGGRP